jgi:hypothetical protein
MYPSESNTDASFLKIFFQQDVVEPTATPCLEAGNEQNAATVHALCWAVHSAHLFRCYGLQYSDTAAKTIHVEVGGPSPNKTPV